MFLYVLDAVKSGMIVKNIIPDLINFVGELTKLYENCFGNTKYGQTKMILLAPQINEKNVVRRFKFDSVLVKFSALIKVSGQTFTSLLPRSDMNNI